MKSAVIIAAALLSAAIVAATTIVVYYSPYQSCVRALAGSDYTPADAALACLHGLDPEDKGEPASRPFTRTRGTLATR
jgi:hypothetical protein